MSEIDEAIRTMPAEFTRQRDSKNRLPNFDFTFEGIHCRVKFHRGSWSPVKSGIDVMVYSDNPSALRLAHEGLKTRSYTGLMLDPDKAWFHFYIPEPT